MRIEDTDQKRLVPGAIEKLIGSLEWAGIKHNEGIFIDKEGKIKEIGDFGPYIQSKRLKIYQEHAHKLVEANKAYYCFCTPERLDNLRALQERAKLAPAYDKLCLREVSREDAKRKIAQGEKYVIRFDVPETGETEFEDAVRGKVKFANKNLDDFVILKSDGYPTYHLAHVVDDHLMKTTLVLRGEEWLSSTPKHILLFQAFGWKPPQYGHLCVILNKKTKRKLSKRDGGVSVDDFVKKGYLPEAVVNFIALLGWNPKTNREIFTLEELVEEFDIGKLNKSGAIFDTDKLDWMNGVYLRKKNVSELARLCKPYLKKYEKKLKNSYLIKIVTVEQERLRRLSDIADGASIYFEIPKYKKTLLPWKKMNKVDLEKSLEKSRRIFESISEERWALERIKNDLMKAANPKDRGELLWPLRVALTGREKSSSPWEVAWVLGKEESIKRIKRAVSLIEK